MYVCARAAWRLVRVAVPIHEYCCALLKAQLGVGAKALATLVPAAHRRCSPSHLPTCRLRSSASMPALLPRVRRPPASVDATLPPPKPYSRCSERSRGTSPSMRGEPHDDAHSGARCGPCAVGARGSCKAGCGSGSAAAEDDRSGAAVYRSPYTAPLVGARQGSVAMLPDERRHDMYMPCTATGQVMTCTGGGVPGDAVPRLGGGSGIDSGALGVCSSCRCVALRAQGACAARVSAAGRGARRGSTTLLLRTQESTACTHARPPQALKRRIRRRLRAAGATSRREP